jgi:hypothetical protein
VIVNWGLLEMVTAANAQEGMKELSPRCHVTICDQGVMTTIIWILKTKIRQIEYRNLPVSLVFAAANLDGLFTQTVENA